jgi:SPP1 gp7 family putative phage head morphogenesis protein
MPTVNEEVRDRLITHLAGLERVASGQVRRAINFLRREVEPDLLAAVRKHAARLKSRGTGAVTTKRFSMMLAEVREIIRNGSLQLAGDVDRELRELTRVELGFANRMMADSMPGRIGVSFSLPPARSIVSIVRKQPFLGRHLRDWFGEQSRATQSELRRRLTLGIIEGDTLPQLIGRIRGTAANGFRDGIIAASRRHTEAIVRTANNHVGNRTREEFYAENSDIVEKVQFVAVLDDRTTIECAALDGTTWSVGEGPIPPIHHNCRSQRIPIVSAWESLGIPAPPAGVRAAVDGVAPATTSYGQWLRDQSVARQDEVLGATRARLFRAGKLTDSKGNLDHRKLIDQRYRPLTVKEIEEREGLSRPRRRATAG